MDRRLSLASWTSQLLETPIQSTRDRLTETPECMLSSRSLDNGELLRQACESGVLQHVQDVLEDEPNLLDLINSADDIGWTPLHYATRAESIAHADIVNYLIELGATVDVPDRDLGWTALFMASQFAHPRSLKALLEAGASASWKDVQNRVAADVANGKERRDLLQPPVWRMMSTTKKIQELYTKKADRSSGKTSDFDYKEAMPYVLQLEREIQQATTDMQRTLTKKDEEIHEYKEQGMKSYTKMMRANSQRAKILKEWKHVSEAQATLLDLKQHVGDGMLVSALLEVKNKLALMRETAVANERTQAKVNKVGYRHCVEVLRETMKEELAEQFGHASRRDTAALVSSTLEIPLRSGTGMTPFGFRRKLEAQIEKCFGVSSDNTKGRMCVCW
eukprot:GEMP01029674.1.p1 GENE.GEMP01029674.1~~GEMP01029674.1.p1  ORF type:complete len:391 (+),score=77.14 GEMP01029674.1:199-1371(+)